MLVCIQCQLIAYSITLPLNLSCDIEFNLIGWSNMNNWLIMVGACTEHWHNNIQGHLLDSLCVMLSTHLFDQIIIFLCLTIVYTTVYVSMYVCTVFYSIYVLYLQYMNVLYNIHFCTFYSTNVLYIPVFSTVYVQYCIPQY